MRKQPTNPWDDVAVARICALEGMLEEEKMIQMCLGEPKSPRMLQDETCWSLQVLNMMNDVGVETQEDEACGARAP